MKIFFSFLSVYFAAQQQCLEPDVWWQRRGPPPPGSRGQWPPARWAACRACAVPTARAAGAPAPERKCGKEVTSLLCRRPMGVSLNYMGDQLRSVWFQGTVPRDFRLQIIFMNLFHPSHWHRWQIEKSRWHRWQIEKSSNRKILIILFRHLWVV